MKIKKYLFNIIRTYIKAALLEQEILVSAVQLIHWFDFPQHF